MKIKVKCVTAMSMVLLLSTIALCDGNDSAVRVKPAPLLNQNIEDIRAELERLETATSPINIATGKVNKNPTRIRLLRLALAQQGDIQERARLFENLRNPIGAVQLQAFEDVARLGDREAIYHLAEMLNSTNQGGRITYISDEGVIVTSNDHALPPIRWLAGWKLAEIVENPPIPLNKKLTDEDTEVWLNWWQKHKSEFAEFEGNAATRSDNAVMGKAQTQPNQNANDEPLPATLSSQTETFSPHKQSATEPKEVAESRTVKELEVDKPIFSRESLPAVAEVSDATPPPPRRIWLWWLAIPVVVGAWLVLRLRRMRK